MTDDPIDLTPVLLERVGGDPRTVARASTLIYWLAVASVVVGAVVAALLFAYS